MNKSKPECTVTMGHVVSPIPFKAHRMIGMSAKLLESHYENDYGGAVRRLNVIENQLTGLRGKRGSYAALNAIKKEALIVGNSMALHEVYFDSLGEGGGENLCGELEHRIASDFGSIDQWRKEFTKAAKTLSGGSGWVLLVWSRRFERLFIDWSDQCTLTISDATPILALDMYEHAYRTDFGNDTEAYVDAFMQNIHWGRVSDRLRRATVMSDVSGGSTCPTNRINVSELKSMLDCAVSQAVVLDVRHSGDRERSGVRIPETPWRDSRRVSEWAGELPVNTPIVVYCMYGFWVSEDTASELQKEGLDARYLEGGIAAWRAMGFPSTPL